MNLGPAMRFVFLMFAGWVNREQQALIDYLLSERKAMLEQIGGKTKLRFTDGQSGPFQPSTRRSRTQRVVAANQQGGARCCRAYRSRERAGDIQGRNRSMRAIATARVRFPGAVGAGFANDRISAQGGVHVIGTAVAGRRQCDDRPARRP